MSIKLYTVKCSVHGTYEVEADKCPMNCQKTLGYRLGEPVYCCSPLKRVYDAPNVHYKGSGWAGKDD